MYRNRVQLGEKKRIRECSSFLPLPRLRYCRAYRTHGPPGGLRLVVCLSLIGKAQHNPHPHSPRMFETSRLGVGGIERLEDPLISEARPFLGDCLEKCLGSRHHVLGCPNLEPFRSCEIQWLLEWRFESKSVQGGEDRHDCEVQLPG